MQFLISHCNTEDTALFGLAVFDDSDAQLRWLDLRQLDILDDQQDSGFTGLASNTQHIFAAVQSNNSTKILIFNPQLEFIKAIVIPAARDIHSLALAGDYLYYAASKNSEIWRLQLDDKLDVIAEERLWHSQRYIHLNDVKIVGGETLILSQAHIERDSNGNGCLYNINRQTILTEGLNQAHTIFPDGDTILLANSLAGTLLRIDPQTRQSHILATLPGYVRGIARNAAGGYMIGLSAQRLHSRKQGIAAPNAAANAVAANDYYGQTAMQSQLAISNSDFSKLSYVDYSPYNFEIYDILPLAQAPADAGLLGQAATVKAQYYRMKLFEQARYIGALQANTKALKHEKKHATEAQPERKINWLKQLLRHRK